MFSLPDDKYQMRGVNITREGKNELRYAHEHPLLLDPQKLGFMTLNDYLRTTGNDVPAFSHYYPPQTEERQRQNRQYEMITCDGEYRIKMSVTSVHTIEQRSVEPKIGDLVYTHHVQVKETAYNHQNEDGTMYTQIDLILGLYEVGYNYRILEQLNPLAKYIDNQTAFMKQLHQFRVRRSRNFERMLSEA